MRGQISVEFALLSMVLVGLVGALAVGYLGPEYEWYCVKKAATDAVAKTCDEVAVGITYQGGSVSGRLWVRRVVCTDSEVTFELGFNGTNWEAVRELLYRNVLFHVYVAVNGRPKSVSEISNPVEGMWARYRVVVSGSKVTVVRER